MVAGRRYCHRDSQFLRPPVPSPLAQEILSQSLLKQPCNLQTIRPYSTLTSTFDLSAPSQLLPSRPSQVHPKLTKSKPTLQPLRPLRDWLRVKPRPILDLLSPFYSNILVRSLPLPRAMGVRVAGREDGVVDDGGRGEVDVSFDELVGGGGGKGMGAEGGGCGGHFASLCGLGFVGGGVI